MANRTYQMDFEGLDPLIKQFEELAKEETMREIREKGLQKSFAKMQGGIVWNHNGEKTIKYKIYGDKVMHDKDKSWIGIGFIFDNDKYPPKIGGRFNPDVAGGIVAQYLMYGTPHLKADRDLWRSLHSKAIREAANKEAEEVAIDIITKKLGGR